MLMQPENQQPDGNWTYREEGAIETVDQASSTSLPENAQRREPEPVTWTASEFIAHHKDSVWYLAAVGGFIALSVLVYIFTRDIISIVSITVVFILFLILGGKKPNQLQYAVDNHGISIGNRFYPYNIFKSFAVLREGPIGSITLTPLKRMMPEISIYYAPEDEDRILKVLVSSLPNEQRAERATDQLMKRLRF